MITFNVFINGIIENSKVVLVQGIKKVWILYGKNV
jgi:hypothetical protein